MLIAVHGRIIIENFNVKNKELGTRSRECAVQEALISGEAGTVRVSDARVVELVATKSDTYTMDLLFVRTEGGNKAAIGDFASAWNCRQSYKVNGVVACRHADANTLGESAKVVGVGANPDGPIWTAAEVVVFESLSGLGVNDRVGFGAFGAGAERITRGSRVVGVRRNDVCVGPERSASVRSGFSRVGDEMWRIHPWS